MDRPPLHERAFPRSLPRKRGRRREAIGKGFAHHCVYLTYHSGTIPQIRQFPRMACIGELGIEEGSDPSLLCSLGSRPGLETI